MNPIRLFSDYMRVVGTPTLTFDNAEDPRLQGKKLGVCSALCEPFQIRAQIISLQFLVLSDYFA